VQNDNAPVPVSDAQPLHPGKLLRIGGMVKHTLDEIRRAPIDEEGRDHLRQVYDKVIGELREMLSPELRSELDEMTVPFDAELPTESELRIAQAQLMGWLEGLFHGIQASLFAQQAAAQAQFQELQRQATAEEGAPRGPGGQYL
jgi:hypothetical protein